MQTGTSSGIWRSTSGRKDAGSDGVCVGVYVVENEDVLGLVVGSWAHFPFFSVANTRTWHKSSAVTHHFPAP